MIPDPELRELFKTEFEENIQVLNNELLRLEKNNAGSDAMTKLMRVAHTMKGSARMIGLAGVVTLAHFFEDMLGAVKGGNATLAKADFDRMYRALDVIKDLVQEAVTGTPLPYDLDIECNRILSPSDRQGVKAADTGGSAPIFEPEPENDQTDQTAQTAEIVSEEPQEAGQKEHPQNSTIDSIRVPASRLDTLMDLSAELTISKIQLVRRGRTIEALSEMLEDSIKDAREMESLLRSLERTREISLPDQFAVTSRLLARFDSALIEMTRIHDNFTEDNSRLGFVSNQFEDVVKNMRMLPLSNIFNLYTRMVRDISAGMGKEVEFVIKGGNITADKKILEEMRDPLMHMVRNSIDHGIESPEEREASGKPRTGKITLSARQSASNIQIILEDDGKGLDESGIKSVAVRKGIITTSEAEKLTTHQAHKLIFAPGFSTSKMITDLSGRGVGMEVVQANVERLKGKINIESESGSGTRFIIDLPLSLATLRVMIASINGFPFAIPADFIETTILVEPDSIFSMEGRDTLIYSGEPLSIVKLASILELEEQTPLQDKTKSRQVECIIISAQGEKVAFMVDSLIDEQELLVKPLGMMLKKVRNVSGSAILGTGEVCIVLNPNELIRSVSSLSFGKISSLLETNEESVKKRILLVEDSITTRTQEKRILEASGYEVVTAVDGLEGYQKLLKGEFDAVVSDVEMPNMDGLTLAENIRKEKKYSLLPIVLVTSLSTDEQKKRGLDAGANAYITKSGFDQTILIETLNRLI